MLEIKGEYWKVKGTSKISYNYLNLLTMKDFQQIA